jgi:hypothetical protein
MRSPCPAGRCASLWRLRNSAARSGCAKRNSPHRATPAAHRQHRLMCVPAAEPRWTGSTVPRPNVPTCAPAARGCGDARHRQRGDRIATPASHGSRATVARHAGITHGSTDADAPAISPNGAIGVVVALDTALRARIAAWRRGRMGGRVGAQQHSGAEEKQEGSQVRVWHLLRPGIGREIVHRRASVAGRGTTPAGSANGRRCHVFVCQRARADRLTTCAGSTVERLGPPENGSGLAPDGREGPLGEAGRRRRSNELARVLRVPGVERRWAMAPRRAAPASGGFSSVSSPAGPRPGISAVGQFRTTALQKSP